MVNPTHDRIRNRRMVRWRPAAGAVALFLACFAVFPMTVVGWGFTHLPGDLVDNRLNNYVLEHGYRSLVLGQGDFWNVPFCHPVRGVTARSDSHLGNLPVYAAFRAFGAGPERSFQLWWLSTFALTYAAGIAGARLVGLRTFGACLASASFTFSPLVAANIGHAQLAPRYFVPLGVGCFWLFLKGANAKHLLAAALAWAGQMASSFYLGYFLGLLLGAIGVASLLTGAVPWRPLLCPRWYEWGKRAGAVSLALLLLWPAARPYAVSDGPKVSPDPGVARGYLPQPFDWVTPRSCSALWGDIGGIWSPDPRYCRYAFFGGLGTAGLVVGAAAVAGCVFSARRRENLRETAAWGLAALALGLFFTRFYHATLYSIALELPMVAGMRATYRVTFVIAWPMAVLCGGWVDRWPKRSAAVSMAVAVFAVADVRIAGDRSERYAVADAVDRRTRLADALRKHPEMKCFHFFSVPFGTNGFEALTGQVDAMWAGQMVGVPTINGWTGQLPTGWDCFANYSQVLDWLNRYEGRHPGCREGILFFGTPAIPETDPRAEELRKTLSPIPVEG